MGPYLKILTTINEEDLQKGEDVGWLPEIPNNCKLQNYKRRLTKGVNVGSLLQIANNCKLGRQTKRVRGWVLT